MERSKTRSVVLKARTVGRRQAARSRPNFPEVETGRLSLVWTQMQHDIILSTCLHYLPLIQANSANPPSVVIHCHFPVLCKFHGPQVHSARCQRLPELSANCQSWHLNCSSRLTKGIWEAVGCRKSRVSASPNGRRLPNVN